MSVELITPIVKLFLQFDLIKWTTNKHLSCFAHVSQIPNKMWRAFFFILILSTSKKYANHSKLFYDYALLPYSKALS